MVLIRANSMDFLSQRSCCRSEAAKNSGYFEISEACLERPECPCCLAMLIFKLIQMDLLLFYINFSTALYALFGLPCLTLLFPFYWFDCGCGVKLKSNWDLINPLTRPGIVGGMPSMGVFLRDSNQYLLLWMSSCVA